jgi:hypothetical protein
MHESDWVTVAELIGRSPADCRDRYHQHLQYKDTKRKGTVRLQYSAVYI